jgi:hypothetical protein
MTCLLEILGLVAALIAAAAAAVTVRSWLRA